MQIPRRYHALSNNSYQTSFTGERELPSRVNDSDILRRLLDCAEKEAMLRQQAQDKVMERQRLHMESLVQHSGSHSAENAEHTSIR